MLIRSGPTADPSGSAPSVFSLGQVCHNRDRLRWAPSVGMHGDEPAIEVHRHYAGWYNEKEWNVVQLCYYPPDCTTHVLNVGSTGGDAVKRRGSPVVAGYRFASAVLVGVEGWAEVGGVYVSSVVWETAPHFSCYVSDHPPSRASGPPPSATSPTGPSWVNWPAVL